nr:MAG: hypothetical protein 2 [Barnaviridae sp.]
MGFWVSPRSPVSCAAAASGIDFTTCRVYQPEFTILVLALLCWLIPTMFVVLVRVGLRIKGYFEITETATSFLAAKHKYLTYRSYAIEDGKVFLLASGSSSSSKLRRIELPLEIATKFLGSEYVTARNESIIAGSLQIPVASLPSGQFTLSTGGFVFASCFLTRHNNKFVLATPYHAVEQMRSYDSVDVSDGKRSCALSKKWKMVAGSAQLDFAFIHVPQSLQTFFECKVIKMAAARSGPVSICAMDNSGQVFLSRGRAKFAKVPFVLQHTCSTVPIYSGAPLMSGKTCIGMHVRNVTREFNEAIAIGHLFQHLYKSKNESDFVVNDWRREDSDSDSEQEEDRADRFAAQLYDEERHFFMEMRDGVYSLDDDHEFNPQFRSLHERSWADEMEELDIEQEDYFRYHGYESLPMRSGPGNESLNPYGLGIPQECRVENRGPRTSDCGEKCPSEAGPDQNLVCHARSRPQPEGATQDRGGGPQGGNGGGTRTPSSGEGASKERQLAKTISGPGNLLAEAEICGKESVHQTRSDQVGARQPQGEETGTRCDPQVCSCLAAPTDHPFGNRCSGSAGSGERENRGIGNLLGRYRYIKALCKEGQEVPDGLRVLQFCGVGSVRLGSFGVPAENSFEEEFPEVSGLGWPSTTTNDVRASLWKHCAHFRGQRSRVSPAVRRLAVDHSHWKIIEGRKRLLAAQLVSRPKVYVHSSGGNDEAGTDPGIANRLGHHVLSERPPPASFTSPAGPFVPSSEILCSEPRAFRGSLDPSSSPILWTKTAVHGVADLLSRGESLGPGAWFKLSPSFFQERLGGCERIVQGIRATPCQESSPPCAEQAGASSLELERCSVCVAAREVSDRSRQFVRLMRETGANIVRKSSPGIPFCDLAKTNGQLLDNFASTVEQAVCRRILALLSEDEETVRSFSAEQLVQRGLCDPVLLFIKTDPHTAKKRELGMFRLISSVSVVDQWVERLLFAKRNNILIASHSHIPMKPGMGADDEGLQETFAYLRDMQAKVPVCSTDISGWDWSLGPDSFEMMADLRVKQSCVPSPVANPFERLVRNRIRCISLSVFYLKDGSMYAQTEPGIQLSGCYITGSGNSDMNDLWTEVSHIELALENDEDPKPVHGAYMGDDGVKQFREGLMEKFWHYGMKVKEVSLAPEGVFDFCSTLWNGDWKGQPVNYHRTLFRFLSHSVNDPSHDEWFAQLQWDLRFLPGASSLFERVQTYITRVRGQPSK